ncbi:MAG: gamma-glutamylcyclotransferase family protein [Verrucomicrobiota bacterium]
MNVFVYGTLLVPRIWAAVTRSPEVASEPASLPRYQIARVRQADFPAIVETGEASDLVPGRVMLNVPESAIQRLDAYEDTFYERVEVEVSLRGSPMRADVYRVPKPSAAALLTDETWTLEWFEEHALERYWKRLFG